MSDYVQSVLVTGGMGFIGSHLVERLVHSGLRVTVLDNLSTGSSRNVGIMAGHIRFHKLDIRDHGFADLVSQGSFDIIFHLAANSYVPPSVENPKFDFGTNLEAPFHLLETLRIHRLKCALIVASSAAVYGNPESFPVEETDPTVPVSPYGVSKLATERYVAVYSRLYGIKAAALRFFSVYGPRQRKQIVYDLMVKLTMDESRLEVLGDGTQVRDMVYVEDVAAALQLVAERAPMAGEVYNVGTGQGHTTGELARTLASAMGLTPEIRFTGSIRPGDSEKWTASIERLKKLGFVPSVDLETGLRKTAQWYLSEGGKGLRPVVPIKLLKPMQVPGLEKKAG